MELYIFHIPVIVIWITITGGYLDIKLDDLKQQLVRYITTPNNERGGIWMSGAAPAWMLQGIFILPPETETMPVLPAFRQIWRSVW